MTHIDGAMPPIEASGYWIVAAFSRAMTRQLKQLLQGCPNPTLPTRW
jgi:hypothetical protein